MYSNIKVYQKYLATSIKVGCATRIPTVIERTISLVLGPFIALYRFVLERFTLTKKAVGSI